MDILKAKINKRDGGDYEILFVYDDKKATKLSEKESAVANRILRNSWIAICKSMHDPKYDVYDTVKRQHTCKYNPYNDFDSVLNKVIGISGYEVFDVLFGMSSGTQRDKVRFIVVYDGEEFDYDLKKIVDLFIR